MISTFISLSICRYWSGLIRCWLAEDFKALGLHPTFKQIATLVDHSNNWCRRIVNWIELQERCMPEAHISQQQDATAKPDGIAPSKAQDIPLHLLSSYKFRTPLQPSRNVPASSHSHPPSPSEGQIHMRNPAQHLLQYHNQEMSSKGG